jgi:hypothetical protein
LAKIAAIRFHCAPKIGPFILNMMPSVTGRTRSSNIGRALVREAIVESGAATSVGDEFDAEANFSESHAANRFEFDVAIGRGLHCGDERLATTLALEWWNSSATSSQPWTVTCCRPLAAHRRNQLAESGLGVLELPVAGRQVAPRRQLARSGGESRAARMWFGEFRSR